MNAPLLYAIKYNFCCYLWICASVTWSWRYLWPVPDNRLHGLDLYTASHRRSSVLRRKSVYNYDRLVLSRLYCGILNFKLCVDSEYTGSEYVLYVLYCTVDEAVTEPHCITSLHNKIIIRWIDSTLWISCIPNGEVSNCVDPEAKTPNVCTVNCKSSFLHKLLF